MSWDIHLTVEVDGHTIELPDTWTNYTHNCNRMIRDAGLEEWPYNVDGWTAATLAVRLASAIATMRDDAVAYRAMNPGNGWGDYDSLLPVLERVVGACRRYPSATVYMSA